MTGVTKFGYFYFLSLFFQVRSCSVFLPVGVRDLGLHWNFLLTVYGIKSWYKHWYTKMVLNITPFCPFYRNSHLYQITFVYTTNKIVIPQGKKETYHINSRSLFCCIPPGFCIIPFCPFYRNKIISANTNTFLFSYQTNFVHTKFSPHLFFVVYQRDFV